jgi:NADP-dependent 3-hydroxy acid dehydrogenase YdfG
MTTPSITVITGASQGIGQALALMLAKAGYGVALVARNATNLDAVASQIKAANPDVPVAVYPGSVTDPDFAQATIKSIEAQLGPVDVLINNAGVAGKIGLLQEVPVAVVHQAIDTNLKGPIFWMQAALPAMVTRQRGTIININSVAGLNAFPYWSVYDASKFGLRAVTDAVAEEQRSNGIRVVGIYPGAVRTPIWDDLDLAQAPDFTSMLAPEDVAQAVRHVLQQPPHVLTKAIEIQPLQPAL